MSTTLRRIAMVTLGLLAAEPSLAADLARPPSSGRFVAACEHLGRFCFAEACGRDQIEAALSCRALCPGSVTLEVVPRICPLPGPVVLRRRG